MRVLVLEASTTSAKAMVYDWVQGIVKVETAPFDEMIGNGAAQDTVGVYESLLRIGRRAAENEEIAAVALSGIWHSLAVCNSSMKPVTPTYTWAYLGAAEVAKRLRQDADFTRRAYHTTGCMVHALYPEYKLMFLKENGLDLADKYFFSQGSYHFYRMTGERLSSFSMESGSALLNIHTLAYEAEMLGLCGIKEEQLPILCAHSETRPLLQEAAEKLGIAPGIPVLPALADGALNQVGSGALCPGIMTLSVGTSGALRLACERPVLPETPSTWCYYTAGKYLLGAAISGASNCVDWFAVDRLHGQLSYAQLEAQIGDPQNAPIFLPFLYGERCPGWHDDRKGGFAGLTERTSLGDCYYAILEGVLFNLYQCYEELTKLAGLPNKIFVSGGICHSTLWLSMLSDIFQREMVVSDHEQASLLGGAVLALKALGGIKDIESFSVPEKSIIVPNPATRERFQERFKQYQELYDGSNELLSL